ncbi:CIC11C00000005141 [Sungouiella intermedia]|uniref:CIC11C00000005141 n=1 Tax=Sungouiella intermedia TaxID=45354 RepID=A0A1L0DDG3_9ASCO|nr:CIC11C00000005141 [[Candida] intermedia]
MWPAKRDLGTRITYGVLGNAIVVPEASGDSSYKPVVRFPRLRNHGILFSPVLNSNFWIHPKTKPETKALPPPFGPNNNLFKYTNAVSEDIVGSLTSEAAILQDSKVYDPVQGSVVEMFEIGIGGFSHLVMVGGQRCFPKAKSNLVQMQAVTYVTGDISNVLNVTILMPRKKQVYDIDDDSLKMTPLGKMLVGVPKNTCQCEFTSEILQVVAFSSKWLAIRTRTDVTVLKYSWNNDPGEKRLELAKIGTIKSDILYGKDLAHLQVNPFVLNEFLLADKDGNIGIWQIDATSQIEPLPRIKLIPGSKGPEEFSNWRKVIWSNPNRLLLFSRTSVFLLALDTFERNKLITAQMWSHIQDVVVAGPFAFILTSKEILWTELTEELPLRRLVSWKHFLSDSDTSYRLSLVPCEDNQTFVCAAYSRCSPLIMIYTFGFVGKSPCSVRDPYYIRANCDLIDATLFKSTFSGVGKGTLLCLVEQGRNGEVCFSSLCGERKKAFKKNNMNEEDLQVHPLDLFTKIHVGEAVRAFELYSTEEILPLELKAIRNGHLDDTDQDDLIQQFASSLGANIELFFPASPDPGNQLSDQVQDSGVRPVKTLVDTMVKVPTSLASVAGYFPLWILDVEQLDNMVEQLGKHYESLGLNLESFVDYVSKNFNRKTTAPNPITVKNLRKRLGKTFKGAKNLDMTTILLATRLIQAACRDSSDQLQAALDAQIAGASDDVRSIIEEWDQPQEVDVEPVVLNYSSQIQTVPIIRTQPTQTMSQKQKKSRNGLLHRALTQSQVQSRPNSQSASRSVSRSATPSHSQSQALLEPSQLPLETSTQVLYSQPKASSEPLSSQNIRLDASQPSQAAHLHISLSPPSSQPSQGALRRSGPPTSQKRKKRKGGFA